MMSYIFKKVYIKQVSLTYSCLCPEDAYKIMNVLMEDDMCEAVNDLDISLEYGVCGYRPCGGKKIWSRELNLFIETPEACEGIEGVSVEKQLEDDRKWLEHIREVIKVETGIE